MPQSKQAPVKPTSSTSAVIVRHIDLDPDYLVTLATQRAIRNARGSNRLDIMRSALAGRVVGDCR